MRNFLILALSMGLASNCIKAETNAFQDAPENLSYIFCHGVGGNEYQAQFYKYYNIIPSSYYSFNLPDAINGIFDQSKCYLGQGPDIDFLKDARQKHADKDAVLVGVSRGASTIINYVGKHKPKNIKALVLESPFLSAKDILEERVKWLPMFSKKLALTSIFPKFDFDGEHPEQYVEDIDKNIPVAFICVKKDTVVPQVSTAKLYRNLRDSGHKKCHILILKDGAHANLADNPKYQKFVHAFYAHYNLPHDPELAEAGKKYL